MAKKTILTLNKRELSILLLAIALLLSVFSNMKFEGFRTDVLGGDARGYYAWLPAVFIHHSLDFEEVYLQQKKQHGEFYQGHYYSNYNGTRINKYTAGVALLLSPFFLLALLLSYIFGLPLDGYSILFQYAVAAGGVFYTLLGMFFSYRLLQSFAFSRKTAATGSIVFLLASNIFYYGFMHPGMSHIYSFSMAAMLLYFSRQYFLHQKASALLITSVALGLSLLIRPFNVFLLLLIPVVADNAKNFTHSFRKTFTNAGRIFILIIPAAVIIGIQVLLYYLQTGQIWIWSYPGEGFNFSHPHIFDVLFSYRKGLFIYTPLILLSLFGFIPLIRKNIYRAGIGLVFLLVVSYFISSWWNWFYGDSFGMRPYIDYYILFILLFAYLYSASGKYLKRFILHPLLFVLVILNLVQSYQYHRGIIHHDAMSKEKYWYIFMKTGSEYENILGDTQEALFKESPLQALDTFNMTFDSISENWDIIDSLLVKNQADSSDIVYLMDSSITYSSTFILEEDTVIFNNKELWSEVSIDYYEIDTNAALKSMLVTSVTDNNGANYYYKSLRIKDFPDDTTEVWKTKKLSYRINLPEKPDQLRIYIWNPKDVSFLIDDINIVLYSIKEEEEFNPDQDLR